MPIIRLIPVKDLEQIFLENVAYPLKAKYSLTAAWNNDWDGAFWLILRIAESEDGRSGTNDEREESNCSWCSADSTQWLWHHCRGLSASMSTPVYYTPVPVIPQASLAEEVEEEGRWGSRLTQVHPEHTHTHTTVPGPPKWAGARRNLVGFYGAVEDNRGRHTDCLGGRHSIQANNRSTSVIPPFLCRMPCCRNPPNLCGLAWFGSSGTRPLNRAVCVYSTAGWMLGAVDYQERSVSVLHVEWYIKLCWLTHSGNWTVFCMFIPNFRCPLSAFMLVAGWQEGQPACKKSHSTYPQRVSCGKDGGWGPEGRTEWHRFGWKKTAIKRK